MGGFTISCIAARAAFGAVIVAPAPAMAPSRCLREMPFFLLVFSSMEVGGATNLFSALNRDFLLSAGDSGVLGALEGFSSI